MSSTAPIPQPAAEAVPVRANTRDGSVSSAVVVTPTQMRRPWRSTARTAFQLVLALATLIPFLVAGVYGDDKSSYPVIAGQLLVVSSTVARVMALPQVETFLRTFLPFLAAAPKS
jgi:hypothetical protein